MGLPCILSVVPPGLDLHSKGLLFVSCTYPLERIHFSWAVGLLMCCLSVQLYDLGLLLSSHRLVAPLAIQIQKVSRLLLHTFPDGFIYAKLFLTIACA